MWLVVVGIAAGVVTTLVGLGGGGLLLVGLAAWWHDPVRAMAVTSPALLAGNVHRAWVFRAELPARDVAGFAAASFVGAVGGGVLALTVPPVVVTTALLASAGLMLLREVAPVRVSRHLLPAAGAAVGLGSTVGAGMAAGPLLRAAGLRDGAWVGAVAVSAAAMHLGRLLSLSAGGATGAGTWADALVLASSIPVGNLLGVRLRAAVPEGWRGRLELAGALALVGAAAAGLA